MTGFDKTWTRPESVGISEKLRETVKPQGALKPRIEGAVNKLQGQVSKMDSMLGKLRERDAQLFKRIVAAMQQHDASTSRVLSNELAEIRKVTKMLGNARMALEQVQLRLTTIHDLGDAMVAIGPAMSTMKGLKSSLGRFMPEADSELNSMTQTLNGLMMDSLASGDFSVNSDASNEETDKILQEASYQNRKKALMEAHKERLRNIAARCRLGDDESLDASNIGYLLKHILPEPTVFVIEAVTCAQFLSDQLQPDRPGSWINCGATGIGWSNGAGAADRARDRRGTGLFFAGAGYTILVRKGADSVCVSEAGQIFSLRRGEKYEFRCGCSEWAILDDTE